MRPRAKKQAVDRKRSKADRGMSTADRATSFVLSPRAPGLVAEAGLFGDFWLNSASPFGDFWFSSSSLIFVVPYLSVCTPSLSVVCRPVSGVGRREILSIDSFTTAHSRNSNFFQKTFFFKMNLEGEKKPCEKLTSDFIQGTSSSRVSGSGWAFSHTYFSCTTQ